MDLEQPFLAWQLTIRCALSEQEGIDLGDLQQDAGALLAETEDLRNGRASSRRLSGRGVLTRGDPLLHAGEDLLGLRRLPIDRLCGGKEVARWRLKDGGPTLAQPVSCLAVAGAVGHGFRQADGDVHGDGCACPAGLVGAPFGDGVDGGEERGSLRRCSTATSRSGAKQQAATQPPGAPSTPMPSRRSSARVITSAVGGRPRRRW